MSIPKSVIKTSSKNGGTVTYISNVDRVQYTIVELTRGALRDVGKFLRTAYKVSFHSHVKRRKGLGGAAPQYWVRSKEADMQIGHWKDPKAKGKPSKGFWSGFYEIGSAEQNVPKLGILKKTVMNNVQKIIEIESKYLSELNKDNPDLTGLSEEQYESETV